MPLPKIIYCDCSYATVVPAALKAAVRECLAAVPGQAVVVGDLCELAARKDPMLSELAAQPGLRVAACFPRAVRWLFHRAGAPLRTDAIICNMRQQSADEIIRQLTGLAPGNAAAESPHAAPAVQAPATQGGYLLPQSPGRWIPWFPVIDYDRCKNCRQCVSFCLFGVYRQADGNAGRPGAVEVVQPTRCKTGCPACARVCPHAAIIFPKHPTGPINGAEDGPDAVRVDMRAARESDVYRTLRERQDAAGAAPLNGGSS